MPIERNINLSIRSVVTISLYSVFFTLFFSLVSFYMLASKVNIFASEPYFDRSFIFLIGTLLVLVILVYVLSIYLSWWLTCSFSEFKSTNLNKCVDNDDTSSLKLPNYSPNEFKVLAYSINRMIERLHDSEHRQYKYINQINYVAKHSPLFFCICDTSGNVSFATGKLLSTLGYGYPSHNNLNVKDIFSSDDLMIDFLSSETSFNNTITVDGRVIEFWTTGIMRDEMNSSESVMFVAVDVSDTHLMLLNKELLSKIRSLSENLMSVEEDERKIIAGELHDIFGQDIASIRTYINLAQTSQSDSLPLNPDYLSQIDQIASSMQLSLKNMLKRLWPEALDNVGIDGAMNDLIDNFKLLNPTVTLFYNMKNQNILLKEKASIFLYRIVSELLNNVSKHAKASNVYLDILLCKERIEVIIKDDGRGFDLDSFKSDCYGIAGMKERVRVLGGDIAINATINEGTDINITIPV